MKLWDFCYIENILNSISIGIRIRNSDFSKRSELLDFFFSCLQMAYQYGTSYTATLDLNWKALKEGVEIQIGNRDREVKIDC